VPVSPPFSVPAVLELLGRLHVDPRRELHFVYVMVVPRSLPVGALLPEDEARADRALSEAQRVLSAPVTARHVARGRNITDAIIEAVGRLHAHELIAGLDPSSAGDTSVTELLESLRERVPCPFVLTQQPPARGA
jgi:hypothetical protein